MKKLIYLLIVLTGILIINIGVGTEPLYERILGYMFITLGSLNFIIELMKNDGNKRTGQ